MALVPAKRRLLPVGRSSAPPRLRVAPENWKNDPASKLSKPELVATLPLPTVIEPLPGARFLRRLDCRGWRRKA